MEWGFAVGITAAAFAIARNVRSCGLIARERVLSIQPKSDPTFDLFAFVRAPFIMALKVFRQFVLVPVAPGLGGAGAWPAQGIDFWF